MTINITNIWKVDGEICISGIFRGVEFQLVHCDTDIDYGWHSINYLPQYSEYKGIDDDCDEWEELIYRINISNLKQLYYGGLVDGRN